MPAGYLRSIGLTRKNLIQKIERASVLARYFELAGFQKSFPVKPCGLDKDCGREHFFLSCVLLTSISKVHGCALSSHGRIVT
jgi:hypothetical protein